jgi:Fur family transcriptional regulator, ferric uptake regulator
MTGVSDTKINSKVGEVDRELRMQGLRLTPRRLMVVEVLAAHGDHLTVEDILSEVRKRHPSTNKTTVYRTLEQLVGMGLVVVTDLGSGRLEYELLGRPHHHLICERCNTRIEVEDHFLEPLRQSLMEHYGFSTNLYHFALFGICPDCAAA